MSASILSITANAAAGTRRRSVLSGQRKKGDVELANDGMLSSLVDNNGEKGGAGVVGDDDRIAVSNKDFSYSIRGAKVLEGSRDAVQVTKPLQANSTVHQRRTRKTASSKSAKPRWQTVLRVFTKNFLLLVFLAGLVQMIRKLVVNFDRDGSDNVMGFSDMEGRIADVESYVKTTAKMLRVQLEAVDKKMGGQLSNLRGEMNKRFEEKGEEVDSRLVELDRKNEFLEKALGELTSKELLSKEDFGRFYEEFRKTKVGDSEEGDLSLDKISALAKQIVEKEIEKHAADGLGRADYALAMGGAMVVKHSEPFVVGKGGNWLSMKNRRGVHSDAEMMLKPSFGEPGQCFPLKGSSGFVQIKLRTAIVAEAVTLEHVAKSVAYDQSSAPRDCRVFGWLQGQEARGPDTDSPLDGEKMLLTEFSYDLDKSNAQTFNVFDSASSAVVDTIRFDFSSNHGSPSHTCIYRVRVHGHEPTSLSRLGGLRQ